MSGEVSNHATRVAARYMRCEYDRDRAGAGSFLAPDIVSRDHRPLLGGTSEGRDAFLEAGLAHQSVGFQVWSARPIEVRGESIALVRVEQASESGFTVSYLAVLRSDDEGRLAEIAIFEEDDLDAAIDELDRLDAEHADAPSPDRSSGRSSGGEVRSGRSRAAGGGRRSAGSRPPD